MCPGCLSLINMMSVSMGIEREFMRESVGSVCVCVFITEAPMVVLCLQFCVTMKVEGLSSNSFHILLKVYGHSCCCSYQPHIFTVGSLCKVTTPFARMVLNVLLSFTVSKQDPTLLYGWNLCS